MESQQCSPYFYNKTPTIPVASVGISSDDTQDTKLVYIRRKSNSGIRSNIERKHARGCGSHDRPGQSMNMVERDQDRRTDEKRGLDKTGNG